MIGTLTGTVAERNPPLLVIQCGGVGYEVWAPMPAFDHIPENGETVHMFIHPVIKEDSQTLYGFVSPEDRQMFRAMIRINGVGAKSALAILSTVSPATMADALENDDISMLLKAPGIGRKTAERIMMELRGQGLGGMGHSGNGHGNIEKALISLGFSQKEIRSAVSKLPPIVEGEQIEDRIRQCLRLLSK